MEQGAQAHRTLVKCPVKSQGTGEKQTPGGCGERSPRLEEKLRNSPTLVRALKFNLSAPIVQEFTDDENRSCEVLMKLIILVKPQPRAIVFLRYGKPK